MNKRSLKKYRVIFYKKDALCYKGIRYFYADSEEAVIKLLFILETIPDPTIPKEYDSYKIEEVKEFME